MSLEYYVRNVFKKLKDDHFKILGVIESNLTRYEIVPPDVIRRQSGLGEKVDKILSKLHEYKLIWAPRGLEHGYSLNYHGLDILALKSLVDRDVIEGLGKPLGVGKEADVYDALSPKGERLAVKFYRIGRTSFRGYERARTPIADAHTYMVASIKSAAREYQALRRLHPHGIAVPKPIHRNRHVIVTEIFHGIELARIQYLPEPGEILRQILQNMLKAMEAGIVHSDLSAYNVLVTPEGNILIIDWPQWVPPSHPMASSYVRRDVGNLLKFFRRRWGMRELPGDCVGLVESLVGERFNNFMAKLGWKGANR